MLRLDVFQRGQRISLTVDDVTVLEHVLPSPLPGNQLGLYAMSKSPVLFQDYAVERRSPMAFVAMQFGEPYDTIYRTVIRPKAQQLGFEVLRMDEINRPGIIFQDIFRKSKPRPNSAAWRERTNESPRGVCWLLDTDSLAPI